VTPNSDVRLNEVMPVPAEDGSADDLGEWIELYHDGLLAVDLSGWFLDDGPGGSEPYRMPDGLVLEPGAFALFHGSVTGIDLEDSGERVRLFDAGGIAVDVVIFGQLAPNASYSRDDADVWHDDWPPSPGGPNLSAASASPARMQWTALELIGAGSEEPGRGGVTLWIR
jgi:hypothetical protein